MSGIAIIGSAIASALLGKVFGKVIDAKEPPSADKKSFQQALDQISANAKADGVCKAGASSAPYASSIVSEDGGSAANSEPLAVARSLFPLLDILLGHSSAAKTVANDAGYSRDDLGMMIGHTGESDFQRAFMLHSVVDNFAVVDADKNGKISDKEMADYERFASISGVSPLNTAIVSPAGVASPPSAASVGSDSASQTGASVPQGTSVINTVTEDSLAKVVAQLMTAYQVDPPQLASSNTISQAV